MSVLMISPGGPCGARLRRARLPQILLVLLGLAPWARAEEATIALNFQDVEIPVLARFVSEVTGRNFIVDDRVRGKVSIISPTRIAPEEVYLVFQSVLQVKGFTTVPSGAFTKIVPIRDARESGAAGGDEVVTRILPLAHAEAVALIPVLQPLVSKDGLLTAYAPRNSLVVVDAAGNVERITALLRELDAPSAATLETIPLRYAAAPELAESLRQGIGAEGDQRVTVVADARTNTLVIGGPAASVRRARALVERLDQTPAHGSSDIHVIPLRHADADTLVRVLSQLLGLPVPPPPPPQPRGSSLARAGGSMRLTHGYDGGLGQSPPPAGEAAPPAAAAGTAEALEAPVRLTADPATNALVVSATPQDWETLRAVVETLDVPRRQVFVEAIIVEATVDRARALGVEFQATTDLGDYGGLAQANLGTLASAATDPTSLPGLLLAAASNQKVRLPNGQEVPAQTFLLTALEADSDVNVLSAPNLVTTDNEEAEIVVGRNVPFIASRATDATNLENLFTTIERHDVGVMLRLRPQITADDFVRLTLFEEVSDIEEVSVGTGDPNLVGPTTTIRSASTAISARDGQTVVIGGLLSDNIRQREQRVPYIGRIPVIGWFFRRSNDRRTKTNLLVFLTPHILSTEQQMAENSLRQRRRMPKALRESPSLRWDDPKP
jgi:general secretion pathway protein D